MNLPFQSDEWKSLVREGAGLFGIRIQPDQADMMAAHAEELLRWNARKNLTAITDPRDVAVKHFVDSLVPVLKIPDNCTVIDIGSGGGFPGIPLAVMNPSLQITLVDASRKKVNFLKQVIRILNLNGIEAIHARIEDLGKTQPYAASFDVAVSRAFTDLNRLAELAAPLLNATGRLIAMKSRKTDEELKALAPPFRSPVVETYTLPFIHAKRSLIIL